MTNIPITVRSYGWAELAGMYNPDLSLSAACKILHRWIDINVELKTALRKAAWIKGSKRLTPLQVETIFLYLGTP